METTMHDLDTRAFPTGREPSLRETLGSARAQLLQMHLLISNLRITYHMTAALGAVFGIAGLTLAVYGGLQIAGSVPITRGSDPSLLIAGGAVLVVLTVGLAAQRMSVVSVLLRAMRREVAVLEAATREAEDEMLENAREGRLDDGPRA